MNETTYPFRCARSHAWPIAVAPLGAQSADPVAKVNGKEIPQSRTDFVIKANAGQGQADRPDLRNRVREVLIRNELLAQEAAKKGLDKTPEYMTQVESERRKRSSTPTSRITSRTIRSAKKRSRPNTTAPKRRPATWNTRPATFS